MRTCRFLNFARTCKRRKEPRQLSRSSQLGNRSGGLIGAAHAIGSAKQLLTNFALALGLAAMITPTWAETADDLAKQYKKETMEQALQTKERFDLYGLRFESDLSTIPAGAKSLLDDIATTLKNSQNGIENRRSYRRDG